MARRKLTPEELRNLMEGTAVVEIPPEDLHGDCTGLAHELPKRVRSGGNLVQSELEQTGLKGQIAVPELVSARSLYGSPSPARRRSRARYYATHAEAIRQKSARYYEENREAVLARRKRRRRLAIKIKPIWNRPTEEKWLEIERTYLVLNRQHGYHACTFRQLSLMYWVSPSAIQRRSSARGGWGLRPSKRSRG